MTLLTSCNDDRLLQEDSGRMPIQFSTCDLTLTRADDGLNNNGTFFDGSTSIDFKIAVDGRNYTYSTAAANTAMTSTSPAYFPIDGTTSVKVQAYYPADKMQYATSAQTFTVAANQTTAADYKASDLMYGVPAANGTTVGSGTWNGLDANGKVVPTTDPVPLVFTHKMVKIKVVLTPSGSTVKKVELKNIKRAIDFDPTDGSLGTAAAVTGTDVTMYNNTTGTTSTLTTTALIPKQTIATTVDFLTITTSDHTLNYRLPAEVTFDAGKQYIYNVTVNTDQITVTSNITDWGTETYTPGDGLAIKRSVKMNPLWYVATGNMTAATTMGTSESLQLYTWANAMSNFSSSSASKTAYYKGNKTITGQDGTWHLPIRGEWLSILPAEGTYYEPTLANINLLDGYRTYTNQDIIFGFNAETKGGISESSYWKKVDGNMHAVRFLGTNYCSAWKYEFTGTGTSSSPKRLKIYAKLIEIVEDNSEAASAWYTANWSTLTFDDDTSVIRDFYSCGYKNSASGSTNHLYTSGYLWSASENSSDNTKACCACFGSGARVDLSTTTKADLFTVRMFRDN